MMTSLIAMTVTIGLVLGSGCLLARATSTHWQLGLVAAASAGLSFRSSQNPLWWLTGAALLGALGLLA